MGRYKKLPTTAKKIGILIEKDVLDKLDELNFDKSIFFNDLAVEWIARNYDSFRKNRTDQQKRVKTPTLAESHLRQKYKIMKENRRSSNLHNGPTVIKSNSQIPTKKSSFYPTFCTRCKFNQVCEFKAETCKMDFEISAAPDHSG